MDVFAKVAPQWTNQATLAFELCCPKCGSSSREAEKVWLNRYAPVITEGYGRKWQEFYYCKCSHVWWAWNNDRPPADNSKSYRDNHI